MPAGKKSSKQKPSNKSSNSGSSASEPGKQKLRVKRKSEGNFENIKKKHCSSSKSNFVNLYGPEKRELFTRSFDFSPLNYIKYLPMGQCSALNLRKYAATFIINDIAKKKVPTTLNPFERRVTAIAWHPKYSQIAVAASKGGELSLYNLNKPGSSFIPGIGPGGSIVGLKFHQDDPSLIYTTSITGDIRLDDFSGRRGKILASIGCFDNWFSSLDVCYNRKLLISGNTAGNVCLISVDGQKVWPKSKHLHKKKITHVEFSAADPNIFVTSSIDHSVKLWDLRMMSDSELKPKPIREFVHVKGVNSAYFSPSNRHSLLTTDQHSEIRVYKSPMWDEELIINHPHRHFQHLTPIKATWHPLEDIIVVGRYPDCGVNENTVRYIDFFDGSTGKLLHKWSSPNGGILSLNVFNISGDCLASGTGSYVVFWKDKDVFDGLSFQKSMVNGQRRTLSLI
ncbi:DNA damage-binding protein 2-like [Argiope bruennichi]|uniref:Damage-specific DNA-binding protein 2 n=1 Tax=Argiope bruennichi TaxID=94029 RepID=A0A8T0EGH8_ARGBR|nr:DNA damage-binding protein 2-like [Argiope bruennichi]KAF8772051.1 DNA damage-binding protein 2 like protein [Argiope bruennichi]